MWIARGATRLVIVVKNQFVVKFPSPYSWRHFLNGLLANLQEKEFGICNWQGFCPVTIADPLGFGLVMPYARPLNDDEWENFSNQIERFIDREDYCIPVENKQSSFGMLNGEIVAIDYGS